MPHSPPAGVSPYPAPVIQPGMPSSHVTGDYPSTAAAIATRIVIDDRFVPGGSALAELDGRTPLSRLDTVAACRFTTRTTYRRKQPWDYSTASRV